MWYPRIVLGLAALMFASLGVLLVARPEKLATWVGIHASSAGATTELRAWYGGLEIAIAALLVWGIVQPSFAPTSYIVLAAVSFGPLVGRLVGFVADKSTDGTLLAFAATEVAFGVLGVVGWLRTAPVEG
ncbi:MAG: DUF4345 family protein [Planctomycetes bacterium]|nr:DUF4345 family protein [Planctomycetota bacterium]